MNNRYVVRTTPAHGSGSNGNGGSMLPYIKTPFPPGTEVVVIIKSNECGYCEGSGVGGWGSCGYCEGSGKEFDND